MSANGDISRRALMVALAAGPLILAGARAPRRAWASAPLPTMVVMKDPSCGCCGAWIDHVRAAGFPVEVIDSGEMDRHKRRLGVPAALASCHTAEVGGYVVEGHVPAAEIERLLAERPRATGLAAPGMPVGSPGMEVPEMAPDTYDLVLFGPSGQSRFARYRGAERLPG
jgi:hypothetical protein